MKHPMENLEHYIEINRRSWNNRVLAHVASEFYDQKGFLEGKNTLKEIELDLLGDVRGLSVLHLQCHFGQDTLSLCRMGARVTGVDISDKAIEVANETGEAIGCEAKFICCDLYSLPNHLQGQFDLVFSSYGTIGWLPDLDGWAGLVARYLKPGGKFVFAEFHPVVWMMDDGFTSISYDYFNTGPILESETGTYADRKADIQQDYVMWNHGLGEVMGSLKKHGLNLDDFKEFDYSPYNCFQGMVEFEPGKFRIGHLKKKIPMVYGFVACKPILT
jgi:SAM-dependent methyltransferase